MILPMTAAQIQCVFLCSIAEKLFSEDRFGFYYLFALFQSCHFHMRNVRICLCVSVWVYVYRCMGVYVYICVLCTCLFA